MADNIGNKAAHDYHLDIAPVQDGFYVKGAAYCDWGMKNRLAKIFQPKSGNTVMLAFDHGYIMGPTAGLERIDLVVPPLAPYVDVLMGTKGVIRSCVSPAFPTATCVRITYDTTVLFDEMSNGGGIACDIENAIRMNADCMAVQTFIGAPGESRSLELLARQQMPVRDMVFLHWALWQLENRWNVRKNFSSWPQEYWQKMVLIL